MIQRNRNLSSEDLADASTGNIISGSQAVDLGLADKIGDILSAEEEAKYLAGIWGYIVVQPEMNNIQRFLKALI